jgi:hypothetical protein
VARYDEVLCMPAHMPETTHKDPDRFACSAFEFRLALIVWGLWCRV